MGLYSGGAYIWNEVSVSTCGGLIHGGGLIFGGGGLIVGGLRYIDYGFMEYSRLHADSSPVVSVNATSQISMRRFTFGLFATFRGFLPAAFFKVSYQALCDSVRNKPTAPLSYSFFRRLKLSMITPTNRLSTKNEPNNTKTTKYRWAM